MFWWVYSRSLHSRLSETCSLLGDHSFCYLNFLHPLGNESSNEILKGHSVRQIWKVCRSKAIPVSLGNTLTKLQFAVSRLIGQMRITTAPNSFFQMPVQLTGLVSRSDNLMTTAILWRVKIKLKAATHYKVLRIYLSSLFNIVYTICPIIFTLNCIIESRHVSEKWTCLLILIIIVLEQQKVEYYYWRITMYLIVQVSQGCSLLSSSLLVI